jgi:hypothetical protein
VPLTTIPLLDTFVKLVSLWRGGMQAFLPAPLLAGSSMPKPQWFCSRHRCTKLLHPCRELSGVVRTILQPPAAELRPGCTINHRIGDVKDDNAEVAAAMASAVPRGNPRGSELEQLLHLWDTAVSKRNIHLLTSIDGVGSQKRKRKKASQARKNGSHGLAWQGNSPAARQRHRIRHATRLLLPERPVEQWATGADPGLGIGSAPTTHESSMGIESIGAGPLDGVLEEEFTRCELHTSTAGVKVGAESIADLSGTGTVAHSNSDASRRMAEFRVAQPPPPGSGQITSTPSITVNDIMLCMTGHPPPALSGKPLTAVVIQVVVSFGRVVLSYPA